MVKFFGAMIDLEYAKGLDENQFKKEFTSIFGIYTDEAWAEIEKLKDNAKSFRKAK